MVFGFSAEYKDKRVDKILEVQGITIDSKYIFYAPIKVGFVMYFLVYVMLSSVGLGLGSLVYGIIKWDFDFAILNHLFVAAALPFFYLFWAKMSNSFVVSEDAIYIINPNFPFTSFRKIEKNQVKRVLVGRNNFFGLSYLFLSFHNHYVEVYVGEKDYRFYCAPLQVDAFDENWTKKTLDDLYYDFKNKKYYTVTTIKDL